MIHPFKLIPRNSERSVQPPLSGSSSMSLPISTSYKVETGGVCFCEPVGELIPRELRGVDSYGVYQIQQRAFEDRYTMTSWGPFRYCAIFDGHGGPHNSNNHVVDYCATHLHNALFRTLQYVDLNNEIEMKNVITSTFIRFDTEMFLADKKYGTTCTIILIDDIRNKIYQINAGDSRSIIFDSMRIISVTIDHTPEFDRQRIMSNRGYIINGRINGTLMISRGFGDFSMKTSFDKRFDPINNLVSVIPTITIIPKQPHLYALLTSDAPFENDVFINEDLVYLAQSLLNDASTSNQTSKNIANHLVNMVAPKTTDDTTIIVVII